MNKYTKTTITRLCKSYASYALVGALFWTFIMIARQHPETPLEGRFLQDVRQNVLTTGRPDRRALRATKRRQSTSSVKYSLRMLQKKNVSARSSAVQLMPLKNSSAPALVLRDTSTPQTWNAMRPVLHGAAESVSSSSASSVAAASSTPAVSVVTVSSAANAASGFPAFERAIFPVGKVPNWGAMRTPAEWNRSYKEMTAADFVPVPRYDMAVLTTPLFSLASPLKDENIPLITTKLFYSTRYFGDYNVDAGEFTAVHPGIDLKLALGTPVGAVAGGEVHAVRKNDSLGLHVILEHRISATESAYSIYGHLGGTSVSEGDTVRAGQSIGQVGMTGNTTGPHLHFQIDKGTPEEASHTVYWPSSLPSGAEARNRTYHPMTFVTTYAKGLPETVISR